MKVYNRMLLGLLWSGSVCNLWTIRKLSNGSKSAGNPNLMSSQYEMYSTASQCKSGMKPIN